MKKWLSLLLAVLLCLICIHLSSAEEDEDISIAEYLAEQSGSPMPNETAAALMPEDPPGPVDKTKAKYEWDGSILLTLSFTGDVTIGSNVQAGGKSMFERELSKQKGDINFPFRNVKAIFDADDLTVINFEGTLTTAGRNETKLTNDFLFRAPPDYVSMLAYGGVDAVSFENNHAMDMGIAGNEETKKTLLDAGIAYASEDEPAILTIKGVQIGLLAYQTFGGRHEDLTYKVPKDIAALRDAGCQIVVVNYHWGMEKEYAPNDNQIMLGRATIDGGADLVIGHHSHRINPIEYYRGKYICYSLGNFSFAGHNKPDDMATFIFQIKMRLSKDGALSSDGFVIIPCRISSRTDYNDFTPTPHTKEQNIESMLSVLKKNGEKLEYAVKEYHTKWPGQE